MRRLEVGAATAEPTRLSSAPAGRFAHRRWFASTLAVVCAGHGVAHAEKWTIEPAIETRATYTDNAAFEDQGQSRGDTIFELIPSVALRGEGKRFRIFGNVGLNAVTYVNGTSDNRILPNVDLTANLEAIERFFFLEAGVVSRQGAEDVFGPRPDGGSDFNTVTTTQYRVIPMFQGRLGNDIDYRLRSSNSWTKVSGTETSTQEDGAYLGDHSLRIERRPSPFGWAFEAARSDTRFESADPPSAIVDSARISLTYAFGPSFVAGLRGGYEKTNLVVNQQEQAIYGVELKWRPSERTDLNGFWEERFFGSGWRFRFDHRMPRIAWNISLSRDIASFPQAFLSLPPTNNVAGLLDAAFTTRFPDPTERARIVADLMARQGLPSTLLSETSLFAQRVSILNSRSATVAFLGIRNSLAFSVFSSRTEDLPDSIFLAVPGSSQNNEQQGGSVTYSHQITTITSLNLTGGYTRTLGLGVDEGTESKQKSVRVQVTRQLAPKTQAYIGARVQYFDSNVPGTVGEAREHAAFVGLGHRF